MGWGENQEGAAGRKAERNGEGSVMSFGNIHSRNINKQKREDKRRIREGSKPVRQAAYSETKTGDEHIPGDANVTKGSVRGMVMRKRKGQNASRAKIL